MLKKLRNRDQDIVNTDNNLKDTRNKVQIQGKCFKNQNENYETQNNLKNTKISKLEAIPINKAYKNDENINKTNLPLTVKVCNPYNYANSLGKKKIVEIKESKPIDYRSKCKFVDFYDPLSKRSFSMPSYKESDLPFFKNKLFQTVKLKVIY